MHHVDQLSIIVILIIHIMPAHLKDFSSTSRHSSNSTIPVEVYISYSHNPLGESKQIAQTSKSKINKYQNRSKRGALQLFNMVVCATGCNPLLYKGYGCYCGFLGSGYPVDPIDRCCKMHDWCYDAANCPMFLEYFIPYMWTCYMGQPICEPGYSCSHRLCECDRQLAECLRRYPCPRRKAVCTSSWRLFQNWGTL